jgi:glutamine---fructose-6-phosphate transaminase (isomerizing)
MSRIDLPAAAEFNEAPAVVRRQAGIIARPVAELVARLNRRPPLVVVTCARGSSANAADFGKHLIERSLGIPVAPIAPSIATIYRRQMQLAGQLFLAVSQSGCSDDLLAAAANAKAAGALVAAIVNDAASPLAARADIVLPMAAGRESSIAATKTFVATLSALLRLVAAWAADRALATALELLPERLTQAAELDWSAALPALTGAASLMTIGRGPTLAIAREVALKLKEGCDLHAEAFSGAEFLHGPIALVSPRYPVMILEPSDAAGAGLRELAVTLDRLGALVLRAGPPDGLVTLPVLPPAHPDIDAVCLVQTFYRFLGRLAAARGADPDRPRHLQKITRTT